MTLTEAAFWFKRFSKVAIGIALVVVLIVLIVWDKPGGEVPLKYITANCACTEKAEDFTAHKLTIPSYEITNEILPPYEFQTESGQLDDNLPKIVNVYEYVNLGEQINARAEAMILAKKMGFNPDRIRKEGDKEYRWKDNRTGRELWVTSQDLNFKLFTSDLKEISKLRKQGEFPSPDKAITIAGNALNSLGVLDSSYTADKYSTYLIKIEEDGTFTEADSLIEADLIRVDFTRQASLITVPMNIQGADQMVASLQKRNMEAVQSSQIINDERVDTTEFITLVVNDNPNKSNISVYVGVENDKYEELKSIYQIDYKTWSLSPESCGTYPLIGASVAEEKIKNGQGSLVFLNYNDDQVAPYAPQEIKNFLITEVTLAYYEGSVAQRYLQPIYFFTGVAELKNSKKADFHIYYPAIDYDNVTDRVEIQEVVVEQKGGIVPSL